MARNYANVSTERWRPETGYGNLSQNAQHLDYVLQTQPDISAAGVLSLNVKRWASRARDTTPATVIAGLQELEAAGIVLYDTETEELLRRRFVKDDGGYGNRKRRPVIERAARDVESPKLRAALAEDLAEVGLPVEWVGVSVDSEPTTGTDPAVSPPARDIPAPRTPDSTFPQVDSLSDGLSREPGIAHAGNGDSPCHFDGVVVTQEGVVRPQPSTHVSQPVPPSAAPAVPADATGLFDPPPPVEDPEAAANEHRNRAFGIARWWIDSRKEQNTPVVAGGKNGPLHPLRSLIEQFTPSYTDDEIKQAFIKLDQGFPSKNALEKALVWIRRGAQRQTSVVPYQPEYTSRGVAPLSDSHNRPREPVRENANSRNARGWLDIEVSTAGGAS